jgi:hypothetical protein
VADTTTTPRHGAWLILIGIAGLLTAGLLALPGFFWSRWLRPFSKPALVGYGLCWISVTFAPIAIYYLFASDIFNFDRLWPLAVYILSAGGWLALRRKFISQPSRSIGRAFLTALAGSLCLAPGIFLGGGGLVVLLPQIACLALNAWGWATDGAVLPPSLVIEPMLIMTLPAFIAHLVVYWPARSAKSVAA